MFIWHPVTCSLPHDIILYLCKPHYSHIPMDSTNVLYIRILTDGTIASDSRES